MQHQLYQQASHEKDAIGEASHSNQYRMTGSMMSQLGQMMIHCLDVMIVDGYSWECLRAQSPEVLL